MTQAAVSTALQTFRDLVVQMSHFQQALRLMEWDERTGAPRRGVELRAEAVGTVSDHVFRLGTSPQMEECLLTLSQPDAQPQLDPVSRRSVAVVQRQFERDRKIPPAKVRESAVLATLAGAAWEEARSHNDFATFRPWLEQTVALQRDFAALWGFAEERYDGLLDAYEPGMTARQLDALFATLRQDTIALVQAVAQCGRRVDETPFLRHYDVGRQRQVSADLLAQIGYDFFAGRLDDTAHPFQTSINRYDVRVTTKYLEHDVRSAIFSTIHEGGHAQYEQGIAADLVDTPLCTGTSMGIHESQSRFWENMIGRSREFWEFYYPRLLTQFPAQLADVSLDAFWRGVNVVQPSLIRIEADEVTYNLHIMLRYELEKDLINGRLQVADLPEAWGQKTHELLGIRPVDDADGVLQDVHWSQGDFGYFPSYALGNMYAAQFRLALGKALPDYPEQMARGDLAGIKHWLNDNIHRHGSMYDAADLVRRVTGDPLDAAPLVSYFKQKLAVLYGI